MKRYKIMTVFTLLLVLSVTGVFAGLNAPNAGDTQLFNVFGQGFFSGYYPISATLQDMNDQTYIFVEDAAINDIDISPNDDNLILLATESGALSSNDGGVTWTHVNGAIAADFLPEGYRTGGGESADQHRVRLESAFFFDDDDWVVGAGIGHHSFGDVENFGPYRSKNSGDKWSAATSGYYSDGNSRASIYEMVNEPADADNFFAATQSGVLMFASRKWKTWTADGFPQVTAEWAHLPVYDVIYDDAAQVLTAATMLGLYQGTVDFDNEQVSWIPLGTAPVGVNRISTYIDSSYATVEVTTYDTTTVVFTGTVVGDELAEGGYLVTVDGVEHTVFNYIVTGNSVDLIASTLGTEDVLTVEIVSPRVYLDGDGVLTPNQWVAVIDASTDMRWTGKARNIAGEWYVELNGDNNYFADLTSIDPDTVDYQTYLPLAADVSVIPSGDMSFNSLTSDGSLLYASAADGIYTYADSLTLLGDTEGMVVNDLLYADAVYAGTATGLYKLAAETWSLVSPIITDGYSGEGHEYDLVVNSVAVDGAGNLFFAGPLGGLYKSPDGGASWTQLNKGLTNRNVTLDQVTAFKTNITADVFTALNSWFGAFPDVDGDDVIYTLIADLSDQFYSSQGDGVTSVRGDFYALDQFDPLDSMAVSSNYRDLIMIDNNPQSVDSPGAAEQAAFQLTRMINFNADADEDDWVVNGLSGLGAYIAGLKDVSGDLSVYTNNSLTLWGDVVPAQRDFDHTFIFMEYLYEYYLTTEAAMLAFVADEANGLEGLANQNLADAFSDIYKNFSLAVHLDGKVDADAATFGGGMYDFANLNIGHGGSIVDWGFTGGDSPYTTFTMRENSVSFYITNGGKDGLYWAPGLGDNIVFNIDDNSVSRIFLMQTGPIVDGVIADYDLAELTLNEQNIAMSDSIGDFDRLNPDTTIDYRTYSQLNMFVITYDAGTATGGGIIMHDVLTAPTMLDLGVAQSNVFPNYIDIMGFSDSRIYDDGGMRPYYNTDDDPTTAELEGPVALVTNALGDTVVNETLGHFYIQDVYYTDDSTSTGAFAYRSSFDLGVGETASTFSILVKGENVWGGQITSSATDVVAVIAQPDEETVLSSADQDVLLRLSPEALKESSLVTIISDDATSIFITTTKENNELPVSRIYQVGRDGQTIEGLNNLTLSFDPNLLEGSDIVSVFRLEKNEWIGLDSDVNYSLGEATIEIEQFGNYQVRKGGSEPLTSLPTEYALHGNYPNPFNPSTTIRYDIPSAANVQVMIYNILGQQISTLVNQVQTPGYYSVQWNGLNDSGIQVGSGLYFVRLMTEHGQYNHKMIYMK